MVLFDKVQIMYFSRHLLSQNDLFYIIKLRFEVMCTMENSILQITLR